MRDAVTTDLPAYDMLIGAEWRGAFGGAGSETPGQHPKIEGCSGRAAVEEYFETKTVWIELTAATRDPVVLG